MMVAGKACFEIVAFVFRRFDLLWYIQGDWID